MSTKQVQQIFFSRCRSNNTHAPFNLPVFKAVVSQQTAITEL